METQQRQIEITLRGAGGLLGHRLFRTIANTQRDMKVANVILGTDEESFRRFESVYATAQHSDVRVFMDATRAHIAELLREWKSEMPVLPMNDSFHFLKKSDVIVDTSIISGKDNFRDFADGFSRRKPIIYQSGTYPSHQLTAPPFEAGKMDEDAEKRYRQGDCLLSGIAPMLYPLREMIEKVDLTLLVQRQKRLHDYTLRDNLSDIIMNPDVENRVKEEVAQLLPEVGSEHVQAMVFEVPGHDYYACMFRLRLTQLITREEILALLQHSPRVKVAPDSIAISTGQVEQKLREQHLETGIPLQPIVCFSSPGGVEVSGNEVTLRIALYSKAITMLPNIDTVRGLVRGMPMIEAMRQTDQYCGFL